MDNSRLVEIARVISQLRREACDILEQELVRTLPERQAQAEARYREMYRRNMAEFLKANNMGDFINE